MITSLIFKYTSIEDKKNVYISDAFWWGTLWCWMMAEAFLLADMSLYVYVSVWSW